VHKSLTRTASRNLIIAWIVWTAVVVALTRATVLPSFALGAVFGLGAGLLQSRALKANPGAFAAAVTAIDVRRALLATRGGTLAVALGWLCALALVGTAVLSRAGIGAIAVWFGGYAAFMLARDLLAHRALVAVEEAATRNAPEPDTR
jgi:hypothetical protein